ncbi:helix-turn-helix domain-containing protein [Sphingobacterium thalpophilum]|uniref:helix-turn-helix domain-containing protein n=1 Tax=Sphingobacterium thalpophilum TaxID=259 RepID=UPI003C73129D
MDLKLLQKDVAIILNVSEDCVTYWENNRNEPQVRYYPQIIKFLGYFPFELDLTTFKGRIIAFRYINGLGQKQFAKLMKIDPRTVLHWEKGDGNGPKRIKMEQFLANYDFKLNTNQSLDICK